MLPASSLSPSTCRLPARHAPGKLRTPLPPSDTIIHADHGLGPLYVPPKYDPASLPQLQSQARHMHGSIFSQPLMLFTLTPNSRLLNPQRSFSQHSAHRSCWLQRTPTPPSRVSLRVQGLAADGKFVIDERPGSKVTVDHRGAPPGEASPPKDRHPKGSAPWFCPMAPMRW